MNKPEIVENLAQKANVSKKDAESVLNAFQEVVGEALRNEEEVKLVGFGKFYTTRYKARKISNPKAEGGVVNIPAGITPKFSAGKTLKDTVKEQ